MSALPNQYQTVIDKALAALDLETKVSILAGQDFWTLPPVPSIGLRSLVMSDGPVGVRGTAWDPNDTAVTLPSPTALAATWDPELARQAGRLLGQECRRKGVHLLLAPTVNLHRSPRGGRHFECYSEDPLLTAEIAVGYVTGVQDQGVGTTVKHFVANDSETERMTVDVRVDERTLRELYLVPFERVVAAGGWGVMASYNGVNGATMTEQGDLLRGVLKDEWGFDGVVVSDWTAARSTEATVRGGLDVAMPGPGNPWGQALVNAVRSGAVSEELVDEQVRRVLLLAARVGALSGAPPAVAEADRPAPIDAATLTKQIAAHSIVLARNTGNVLPVDTAQVRRIALIGAAARTARILGGGSATVFPETVVSPLDGLRAALPPEVALDYAIGADPQTSLSPAGGRQWRDGLTVTLRDHEGAVLASRPTRTGEVRFIGDLPEGVPAERLATVTVSGRFTPEHEGEHEFGVSGVGHFTLTLDGMVVYDDVLEPSGVDVAVVLHNPPEQRVRLTMEAGRAVEVSLTQEVSLSEDMPAFVSLTLGHQEVTGDPETLLTEAVNAAAAADLAIVVVATTELVESEGFDRADLELPGRQNELVFRVAAANPHTVVVVNAGSPVLMPWADEVSGILLTWFPGEQGGAALADVLLGAAEPGGRLPTTWPRHAADCPVLVIQPTDGRLEYAEGVFVGYRGWERSGTQPLFGFGHGLGYTTWEYEALTVDGGVARVRVRNAGRRAGREVVQVYLGPVPPEVAESGVAEAGAPEAESGAPEVGAGPDRPARVLAGFGIAAAAPGEHVELAIPVWERASQRWDGGWRTVPGRYTVEAGHSLADRRLSTEITI